MRCAGSWVLRGLSGDVKLGIPQELHGGIFVAFTARGGIATRPRLTPSRVTALYHSYSSCPYHLVANLVRDRHQHVPLVCLSGRRASAPRGCPSPSKSFHRQAKSVHFFPISSITNPSPVDEHFLPNEHTSFKPASPSLTNQLPSSALSKPDSATAEKLAVTSANDSGSPNPLTNMDGFGVGWWSDAFETFENGLQGKEGMRPTVYKNIRPPLNDLVLKSFARGIQTRSVVAHIRAGTGKSRRLF